MNYVKTVEKTDFVQIEMQDGKTIALPDFTKKSDRDAVRDDTLTPFPDENGHVTLPCATGKAVNGR